MKKKSNLFSLIKYIGNIVTSKKNNGTDNRLDKYQPSWMYRNE
jgi:hypothetical protein